MGSTWSQLFPPAPTLKEGNLPSQEGRVFIVTGGASGVGFELARMLYEAGASVYIAGRSETNGHQALDRILATPTSEATKGKLEFLLLDLADLTTIKPFVRAFEAKESRLDVLWNNAAVSLPPLGSTSKQGYELQIATNCLGPFLLSQMLLPILKRTSNSGATPGSIRVVWSSSQVVDLSAPKGGFAMKDIIDPPKDKTTNYTTSKTGNWFLASEFARHADLGGDAGGVLSVTQNPGNLSTNLLRHAPWMKFLSAPLLHPARMGAYTELWAGLSPDLEIGSHNGAYVVPWGRVHPGPRADLLLALRGTDEGGSGRAREFWQWCKEQTAEYA
ncbi:NAD(P)-binding protein [Viridothelium virens]|uniref:NAD(P)-binding protein n=1 Tax=Viridothelium virens TaxID=1048519 RepID=A0A6A6HBT0_VIRVR|nr:NAD(P)-binding protein [Viridothelium virens]